MFFGKIITKRLIELNVSEVEKLSIVPLLDLDSKVKQPHYNSHSYWSSETLPEGGRLKVVFHCFHSERGHLRQGQTNR